MGKLILVTSLLFAPLTFGAEQKIAIVVQTGNDEDTLGFKKSAELAKQIYAAKGYTVVTLAPGASEKANAANLEKVLKDYKDVSNLHIDFVGHGNTVAAGSPVRDGQKPLPEDRFPKVPMSSTEYKSQDGNLPIDAVAKGVQYYIASDLDSPESHIGTGDIRKMLREFQSKNPNSKVTINLENCFSGNVVDAVANLKNVYVTASSPRQDVAAGLVDSGKKQIDLFHDLYLAQIGRGQDPHAAFVAAQTDFLSGAKNLESRDLFSSGLPRDTLQETLRMWCEKEDGRTESATTDCHCDANKESANLTAIVRNAAIADAITPSSNLLKTFHSLRETGLCTPERRRQWEELKKQALSKLEVFEKDADSKEEWDIGQVFDKAEPCVGNGNAFRDVNISYSVERLRTMFTSSLSCLEKLDIPHPAKRFIAVAFLEIMFKKPEYLFKTNKIGADYDFVQSQCGILDAKIALSQSDLDCAEKFRSGASSAEWLDLVAKARLSHEAE